MKRNHEQAVGLAKTFLRCLEKSQYATAQQFGEAAVAACIVLQGPVLPTDSGMVGGAR